MAGEFLGDSPCSKAAKRKRNTISSLQECSLSKLHKPHVEYGIALMSVLSNRRERLCLGSAKVNHRAASSSHGMWHFVLHCHWASICRPAALDHFFSLFYFSSTNRSWEFQHPQTSPAMPQLCFLLFFFLPAIHLCTDCCYPCSDLNRHSVWMSLFQAGITSWFELKIDWGLLQCLTLTPTAVKTSVDINYVV